MQNRNQSDDQTVEQQRKLVAARRKHVGELAAKVRSARRQKRIDVVRDERRELLSAAKEYLWQKQKLDGMMPSDEQAEYADAFNMWGQVEEIDTEVAELNSTPALDVMAVLARNDAISKLHEKRAHLLHMESSEIELVAQASPATEQIPSSVPVQHEQTPAPASTEPVEPEQRLAAQLGVEVAPHAEPIPASSPATFADVEPPIAAEPLQRSTAQQTVILDAIREAGHEPLSLPKNDAGKRGIKALVRDELVGKHKLFPKGGRQFDKAWERLRAFKEIAERD